MSCLNRRLSHHELVESFGFTGGVRNLCFGLAELPRILAFIVKGAMRTLAGQRRRAGPKDEKQEICDENELCAEFGELCLAPAYFNDSSKYFQSVAQRAVLRSCCIGRIGALVHCFGRQGCWLRRFI